MLSPDVAQSLGRHTSLLAANCLHNTPFILKRVAVHPDWGWHIFHIWVCLFSLQVSGSITIWGLTESWVADMGSHTPSPKMKTHSLWQRRYRTGTWHWGPPALPHAIPPRAWQPARAKEAFQRCSWGISLRMNPVITGFYPSGRDGSRRGRTPQHS